MKRKHAETRKYLKATWTQLMIVPRHVRARPLCLPLERMISEWIAAKAMAANVCVKPAQRLMELVALWNIRDIVYTDSVHRVIISLELYCWLKKFKMFIQMVI